MMPQGSANGFSISLPNIGTSGSASPAFALNFDFGANPSQIAQQAYSFVNQSFDQDQGFLQSTIAGTQSFLSAQVSPIISADSAQIAANAQALPQLYSSLNNTAMYSINSINQNVGAAINASAVTAQASIAASQADAANSGGGCFITTCVCEWRGWDDNCAMLRAFRRFRDEYMTPRFPNEVSEYYRIAPTIVDALESNAERYDAVCDTLYHRYLLPCWYFINHGQNEKAHRWYRHAVAFAWSFAHV